jgi:hypothetical protein
VGGTSVAGGAVTTEGVGVWDRLQAKVVTMRISSRITFALDLIMFVYLSKNLPCNRTGFF